MSLDTQHPSVLPFIAGQVCFFAMNSAPSGFSTCAGQAVSRTTYAALFSLVGTLYGVGDGALTFNLPDLRGEFIRGLDGGRAVDSGRGIGTAQIGSFLPGDNNTGDELIYVHNSNDKAALGWDVFSGTPASGSVKYIATAGTIDPSPISGHGGAARPRNVALLACIFTGVQ